MRKSKRKTGNENPKTPAWEDKYLETCEINAIK
jgi:hypothetical protein